MKVIFFTLLLVCAVFAGDSGEKKHEKYTTKYDNINLDEILQNERLLNNYVKCLMDEGRCTPDAQELKTLLPDGLQTACSKCNEKQKAAVEKVLKFLIDKKPEVWKKLSKKYDPEDVYLQKYRPEAEKHGIKV